MEKTINLKPVIQSIESILMEFFEVTERPVVGFCYSFPSDGILHWATNAEKKDGAGLFIETGLKMQNRDNLT